MSFQFFKKKNRVTVDVEEQLWIISIQLVSMQCWSPTRRHFIPHFVRPFYKRFGNKLKSSKQRSPSRQLQFKSSFVCRYDDIALISSSENDMQDMLNQVQIHVTGVENGNYQSTYKNPNQFTLIMKNRSKRSSFQGEC